MINITNLQSKRLLPICEENAPQNNESPRPQCGADAPTFLSAVYNRGTQARKRQADAPQSGRSMIEMLGVLAIIGVLSVGGIAGYSKAMQKYRTNKTIDQITQISNGIHTLYTNRNNYAGLDINVLAKAKVIPQELVETDAFDQNAYDTASRALSDCLYHGGACTEERARYGELFTQLFNLSNGIQTLHGTNPFGGKILLTVEDNAKAFSLNYLGLPEDACIDLLTQDWGTTDLIAAGVDSQITSTYGCTGDKGSHVCNNQLPVSVDKAMDLCSKQNDSKGVILKFR